MRLTIGNELEAFRDVSELRSIARRYAREQLVGRSVVNAATGIVIHITGQGIKKGSESNSIEDLQAIPALNEMLRLANYLGTEPDRLKRNTIRQVHRFTIPVRIRNYDFNAILIARETPSGTFYYHHHLMIQSDPTGIPGERNLHFDSSQPAAGSKAIVTSGIQNVNSANILSALERWLGEGFNQMGEIAIRGFDLRHHEDSENDVVQLFNTPKDAREIAKFDDAGNYRPLKSAPNLRRGWKLVLAGIREVREALDFFYPAMLGTRLAQQNNRLAPVNFRETANRQSGMYAVVKKITDGQADELIGNFCASNGKCLKTILWRIDRERPIAKLPEKKFDLDFNQLGLPEKSIPLPCAEACNLLIAAARQVVKQTKT